MKALLINGSAHANGNTRIALEEVGKTLKENGVDYEIVGIGPKPVHGCIACGRCRELGRCASTTTPATSSRRNSPRATPSSWAPQPTTASPTVPCSPSCSGCSTRVPTSR